MKMSSFNVKDILCILEAKDYVGILLIDGSFHCIEPVEKVWNEILEYWRAQALPIPQNQNQ